MNTNTHTLQFSEIRAEDIALVGGKGANLGEMVHAGLPVPQGFCLTTNAFDTFLETCADMEDLYTLLDTINTSDIESVREIGKKFRDTLLKVPIPQIIIAAIRKSWQEIGINHAYAVRSSATAEDLPDASFAGQQDTYLNIIGESALLEAVRKCWVSLFTDRAILYRSKNNFPHREVKLSVVVQKMIMSDVSGTMFTVDPVTGHRHTLTIDASFGLGEALVSGLVSPDAHKVDKRSYKILSSKIAEKKIAIYPKKTGGTRKEEINEKQSKMRVLNDEQVRSLAEMGIQIETHYGIPQDIEWAIEGDSIFLLQTRPITSLFPIDGLQSLDDNLHIYLSLGHQQSMTNVMSPLGISTIRVLMPVGHSESVFDNTIIRTSGGRMFADISLPLRHRIMRRGIMRMLAQLDSLMPNAAKELSKRPEFRKTSRPRISFSLFRFIQRIMRRVLRTLRKGDLHDFVNQTNKLMDDYENEMSELFMSKKTAKDKLQIILDTMPEFFAFFLNWVPETAAGMASTRLIARRARRWLSADEVESLTLGIKGNAVNEMNLAIGDLADYARQSPQLLDAFEDLGDDALDWIRRAEKVENSDQFLNAWRDFIKRYGSRGTSEIDISKPRWYEDPMPVLKVIREALQREEGYHRVHLQSLITEREAIYEKLIKKAGRGSIGRIRKRFYKRQYHVMTSVGGMREHHKFFIIRLLAIIKEILKDVAQQLVDLNKLEQSNDIWYLTWEELFVIWDDKKDWSEVVQKRRQETDQYKKYNPQFIVSSDGETPEVHYEVKDAPEGALIGNPVAVGIAEGIVHIIRDPHSESLSPGEILVAEFTDPGWTPLFINAKAVILEVGGALTHGAVVAREYGIPAIVGVRDATKKLQTGQKIRVDGNRGFIEILDK